MKDIMSRCAYPQEILIQLFDLFKDQFLMLGIAIHCIQHSQAMLERGVCELPHSFFHVFGK